MEYYYSKKLREPFDTVVEKVTEALTAEDKIGTMLPCNVIVQQFEKDTVEVAAINPIASMQAVQNEALGGIAKDVSEKLKRVVSSL